MKQATKGHVQHDAVNAKGKLKGKAGKKANHPGLQGDEKIGGRAKRTPGQAG
jgi:hypothetical protein